MRAYNLRHNIGGFSGQGKNTAKRRQGCFNPPRKLSRLVQRQRQIRLDLHLDAGKEINPGYHLAVGGKIRPEFLVRHIFRQRLNFTDILRAFAVLVAL